MLAKVGVSAVLPAFQGASTLRAALDSVLGQRPAPDEVLVVDDGSTDRTAEIAAELAAADPRVRLHRQPNAGPSAARNAGVALATGPWIAFCDADDEWLPGKLALQLRVAEAHPAAALIAGDWLRTAASPPPTAAPAPPVSVLDYRQVLVLNRFQTSTVLVRKQLLEAAGGFLPELDGAEDWDMWLRCARLGPLVKIDAPLVVYRDEPTGYSKDLHRLYLAMLDMLDRESDRLFADGAPRVLTPSQFRQLRAWHHLRFAVGFALAGDRAGARGALADLARSPARVSAAGAALRYLAPFLARRLTSRRARRKPA